MPYWYSVLYCWQQCWPNCMLKMRNIDVAMHSGYRFFILSWKWIQISSFCSNYSTRIGIKRKQMTDDETLLWLVNILFRWIIFIAQYLRVNQISPCRKYKIRSMIQRYARKPVNKNVRIIKRFIGNDFLADPDCPRVYGDVRWCNSFLLGLTPESLPRL